MQQKWMRRADPITDAFLGEFERSGPANSFFRSRTTFKISGPSYTNLKLSPYAYYEGFHYNEHQTFPTDPYYFEVEIGFSLSPGMGWTFSLGDQIQATPERRGRETHQMSFILFTHSIFLSKFRSGQNRFNDVAEAGISMGIAMISL